MKTVIVGGGVMGEAILGAAIEGGVFEASSVTVIEKLDARREELHAKHGIAAAKDFAPMDDADVVVLCVKPQELKSATGALRSDSLLISIMAGTTIQTLAAEYGHNRIVRVMPNTPSALRQGISGWTATADVSGEQREFARKLLGAIGQEIYFDDEKKLDMVTAVSGSGPAYVFMFIEALVEGAVSVGLPRAAAEQLVVQTVFGSALYARESDLSPATLRAQVTSPAGTTAAGLLELERGAFRASIIECVRAAHERAMELGRG